jgi:phosphoribosyl-AMP cyclohydrolase
MARSMEMAAVIAGYAGGLLAAMLERVQAQRRARLWKKGESSGNVLRVVEMRIDCDQDAIWIRAEPAGPACHTGERSCFYRRIEGKALVRDV